MVGGKTLKRRQGAAISVVKTMPFGLAVRGGATSFSAAVGLILGPGCFRDVSLGRALSGLSYFTSKFQKRNNRGRQGSPKIKGKTNATARD